MEANVRVGDVIGFVDLVGRSGAIESPVPRAWYILRTFANCEARVMKAFDRRKISAYFPKMTVMKEFRRFKHGREFIERRNVLAPLILGAVLIPDHVAAEVDVWRGIDGVIGLLAFGDWTPHLTPKMFQDIRNIEDIANTPKSKRRRAFEVGQLVRVVDGPFRGFSARVERIDSGGRLSVGVEIFARITPMNLSEGEIEAVEAECA
ncbi:transcription termination/antitermination protein NusG [Bradyrhizobium sp. SZCCHNRI2049]|uniref:transcription termination/antitermination protein NusG n=1 Tax=Bradyrhizobium sp. SZCCHNRI2049 TaxID=3057287 RepID=UPI002916EF29|nr:transcription termination/antitermination NusG family protein [Bradyrhizobium sp. SZCCHNRI2049]